jgi:hypothetical protein
MECLDATAAGIYAQARSMVDWNQLAEQGEQVCIACSHGAPMYSIWTISCESPALV